MGQREREQLVGPHGVIVTGRTVVKRTLAEVAADLNDRLVSTFRDDSAGRWPVFGDYEPSRPTRLARLAVVPRITSTETPGPG